MTHPGRCGNVGETAASITNGLYAIAAIRLLASVKEELRMRGSRVQGELQLSADTA
jgi:hypothetical protein